MPSDAARQADQPALIRTPDQLQQSRKPDRASDQPRTDRGDARPGAPAEDGPRPQGILGQLETERAHD